ncbi:MAG: carbohydrate kinase, partial [Solirubrobacterales bacterium]|nr:carbohydrate kinase [Solirubrobacterales bacterium]
MTRSDPGADVVLGVDIGTTSVKVLALSVDGEVLARAPSRGYPLLAPATGKVVQDPAAVVQAAVAGIHDAAALVLAGGRRVRGLALSAAMHGLVGVDRHDVPITPLITWADTRAQRTAQRLRTEHPGLHARTGTPIHPMSPLVKLVHLREHEPTVFRQAARWVGVKELVVHRLTGAWVVDRSVASGTGLMNLRTEAYDPEALRLAGITADQLPVLGSALDILPALTAAAARETGLPRDTPVILGAGDGPLANLGADAVSAGVAACSIGTSGALRLLVDRPGIDPGGHLFCYALTPGRWVVGGAVNNGGIVLEWAADALAPELTEDRGPELLRLAASVPAGSDGLLMLPHLL